MSEALKFTKTNGRVYFKGVIVKGSSARALPLLKALRIAFQKAAGAKECLQNLELYDHLHILDIKSWLEASKASPNFGVFEVQQPTQ